MAYSPTFQSVSESSPRQPFVPWSCYWCVERIQSRKTKYINASNCVVEVIAQFLILLVAFLAPIEADLEGVTLHRMYDNALITDAKTRFDGIGPKPKLAKALLRLV